ncbi:CHAT domain-containing protein [Irpex rosettiformis]|uniref:CHAT domain-containing protein n=1 Tax=Irpex rosettiformis TaxID=378272 RepID=A0ACB8U1A2_9APHY|nr:CHAT domain-containing protein [Irpex rosettiformis]
MTRARSTDEKDLFFIDTNIPNCRGVGWRKLINHLRAQYVKSTAPLRPKDLVAEHLNPYFICEWLAQGTQPHTTTLTNTLATPSFLHQSPSLLALSQSLHNDSRDHRPVSVSITAPSDYSHFDFVDLTLTLGQKLSRQFGRTNDPTDLDLACVLHWLAVNASPADDQDTQCPSTSQITTAVEFMETLTEWYRLTRIPDVMFEGLDHLESMIATATTLGSTDLIHDNLINSYTSMLMAGLCPLYNPDPRFESALERLEAHIASRPSKHPLVLNNFGYFFRECFEKMGRLDKLDISISMLQKTLELLPPEDDQRVDVLRNLMYGLYGRYRATRDYADLELASECLREAISLESKGVGCIPRWSLLLDFAKLIQEADTEKMVNVLRESHELCPSDHPLRYSVLAYLADALFKRYNQNQTEHVDDLHEAATFAKDALDLAPTGHPTARGYFLYRLAAILSQRTLIAEAPHEEDLNEVVHMAQDSLSSFGKHHKRYLALQLLGVSHIRRYLRLKDVQDALAAHRYFTEVLAVTEAGIAVTQRSECLASLAEIHLFPNTPLYDVMKACRYSEMCLHDPHTDAVNRLTYMGVAFNTFGGFPSSPEIQSTLATLFLKAVDLLPEIAYLGMDVKASLRALRGWESLVIGTSLLCTRVKRYQDAVFTIEKGRAIFWSQALKVRSKATDNVSAELRERLSQLGSQIEHRRHLPKRQSSMPAREWAQDRRLGEQYESVLKQIRELPGHEAFAALSPEELMHIGEKGPVVILTAHDCLCIAYIFVKEGDLIVVELGQVNSTKLGQYVSRMAKTQLKARNDQMRNMGFESPISSPVSPSRPSFDMALNTERALRMKRPTRQATFKDDVLQPLFYEVVKPIFDALHLKPSTGRSRPRLWWCPTGAFTSLPIHAAGDYLCGGCCSDYVVSSYTPTCTALLTARKAFSPIKTEGAKILLAAVPRPFKGEMLRGTVKELERISAIIPVERRVDLPKSDNPLLDPDAGITSGTLLNKLPEASILHLASHGVQDYNNPLDSGFILRDAKLTISELMPLPLPHAFLAFLSACETAKGDKEQMDQVIHLASTMLFSGFKSVVGTMWNMSDIDGPHVASYLYEQLFAEGQDYLDPDLIPYALDEAVQRLRAHEVSSTRWATFIHLGI